jgi:hypothetical protein
MTFQAVCTGWATELQTNVTGLDTTTIPADQLHLYTPWAVELGLAAGRNLAIWPESEPEVVNAATAGGGGGTDLAAQVYSVLVWEDASIDATRLKDDETAADAWLTLFQAIRARFYRSANLQIGGVDTTRYAGGSFDMRAGKRIMQIRFQTRQFYEFS